MGRNCVLEMHTLNDSYKISKLFAHEKGVLVSILTLSWAVRLLSLTHKRNKWYQISMIIISMKTRIKQPHTK